MEKNYFVHESSIVDEGVSIGEGTKIWHFCHIGKGAKIGKGCKIGQNVYVAPDVKIGDYVKIQNNVSLYGGVTLEDYVFCGPSCVFTNIVNPRSKYPQDSPDKYQKTLLKRGASIGANATIVCGHTIGEHAFIGAGAVVTKDIPDYGLVYGNPALVKGWMCECGMKLDFKKNRADCVSCKRKYKALKNKIEQEKG
jgi:UDP-2-acetamido-3-amino-2,3-dideoxy-glucuronate N-acetyltransferase